MDSTAFILTGRLWTFDSWDGERININVYDDLGTLLATHSLIGKEYYDIYIGEAKGIYCDGWYHEILLPITITDSASKILIIKITTELDEDASNESLGYSDLELTPCYYGYNSDDEACCSYFDCEWKNYWEAIGCDADEGEWTCDGFTSYGRYKCGEGTSF